MEESLEIVEELVDANADPRTVDDSLHRLEPGRLEVLDYRREAHDRYLHETHRERLPAETTSVRTQQPMVRLEQQPLARLPATRTDRPL